MSGLVALSAAIGDEAHGNTSALQCIVSHFAASIIDEAVEQNNYTLYPAAFVGELIFVTYEKSRRSREKAAVTTIECWFESIMELQRTRFTTRILRTAERYSMALVAREQEMHYGVILIQRFWRRRCVERRAHLEAMQRKEIIVLSTQLLDVLSIVQETRMVEAAAICIQRRARRWLATRRVQLLTVARSKQNADTVTREAGRVIASALTANAERKRFERALVQRRLEAIARTRNEAATRIQCDVRRFQAQKHFRAVLHTRKNDAAGRIQRWLRFWTSVRRKRRLLIEAESQRKAQALYETVVGLQSFVRMLTQRSKYLKHKERVAAVPFLQRVGRAYLSRLTGIAKSHHWEVAAKTLQRFWKCLSSRKERKERQQWQTKARDLARFDYAARTIQRGWKTFCAKKLRTSLYRTFVEKDRCARRIQHSARKWIARIQLTNLRVAAADENFQRLAHRASVLIQANVRGWFARNLAKDLRNDRQQKLELIFRVATNFQFRKDFAMYYHRFVRTQCAIKIQRAYRHWRNVLEADRRHTSRMRSLHGNRKKELAAVIIQKYVRRSIFVSRYVNLRQKRHYAAIKIQTQIRMLIAKNVLDSLIYEWKRGISARRIQMMWLANVKKFRLRREIRMYESHLVDMERVALLRAEQAQRADYLKSQDDWWMRESYRFNVLLRKLREDHEAKMMAWRERAPLLLQEEAAVKIQSHVRGLLLRSRGVPRVSDLDDDAVEILEAYFEKSKVGGKSSGKQSERFSLEDSRVSQLAKGLQSSSAMLQQHKAVVVDANESWQQWLVRHPHARSRGAERLLHQESAARRHLDEEFEVTSALLFARLSVPANAQLRPLRAVAHRNWQIEVPPVLAEVRLLPTTYERTNAENIERAQSDVRSDAVKQQLEHIAMNHHLDDGCTDLRNLNIDEQQLRIILEKLRNHSRITSLRLDGNRLTDACCIDIADLVYHNQSIQHLSLSGNNITDIGASHIISAAMRSPNLVTVDLGGTLVTEQYKTHLSNLLSRNEYRRAKSEAQEPIAASSKFAAMRSIPPKGLAPARNTIRTTTIESVGKQLPPIVYSSVGAAASQAV